MRPVHQLESALRAWETSWKLANAIDLAINSKPIDKPITCWREFRKFLLNIRENVDTEGIVDVKPFADHKKVPPLHPSLSLLPSALAAWCIGSRRVFELTPELQTLLGATTLKSIDTEDLKQPFTTYAIELSDPVILFGQEFNLAIISFDLLSAKKTKALTFYLFNKKLADYEHMTNQEFERLVKQFHNRKNIKANEFLVDYGARTRNLCGGHEMLGVDIELENGSRRLPITEVVRRSAEKDAAELGVEISNLHEEWILAFDYILRISAGLCLYLQTLPSDSTLVSGWHNTTTPKISGVNYGQGVTNEAHVCSVSTQFKVTSSDREIFRKGCLTDFDRVVKPHFRMGYWSRPKGFGHDPSAPKTIWHRPTTVNAHLLQGALPHGATTKVG